MSTVKDLIRSIQDLGENEMALVREAMQLPPAQAKQEEGYATASSDSQSASGQQPTQVSGLLQLPRLGQFSGSEVGKGEVSWELWKHEVKGLIQSGSYSDQIVLQAMRRSLRGQAGEAALHLGEGVTPDEILVKLEQIFGNVLPTEQLLEAFYAARQTSKESVATWACRVEELFAQLRSRKAVDAAAEQTMLRTKFFTGLYKPAVRTALRHKFDGKVEYAQLLVAARVAELETSTQHQAVVAPEVCVDVAALNKTLQEVCQRLEKLERSSVKSSTSGTSGEFQGSCFKCKKAGHRARDCPLKG